MFDFVGLLVLIVLMAALGFLTVRAWGLDNAVLKWGGLTLAGLLTVIATALLVLALVGFAEVNQRFANPIGDGQVAGTTAQIARGERLAQTCVSCHGPDNRLPLAGVNFAARFPLPPMGTLYAPNLTPGGNVDDWTDGELIRAIREGIHKNGRSLLIMPASTYRNLSDDDVQAIVAYLRSQPPTGEPTPDNRLSVLGAIFTFLFDFRTAQLPVANVSAPQPGTSAHGKYLVDILGCRECHGDQLQGKVDNGQPGPPPGPNLTQIVPQWTEEQFMTLFNTGKLPGGSTLPIGTLPSGFAEPRMPWTVIRAAATDDELRAIFAYLHSLPPVAGETQ